MKPARFYPILYAILAAVAFGVSAPLSKLLLRDIQPVPLAALLYLGCGIAAVLMRMAFSYSKPELNREARLHPEDFPWLIGAVLAGGVVGPILLMVGLGNTHASTASLLLNFESVSTGLIAGLFFHEAVDRRVWLGLLFITLASILLSFTAGAWGISVGAIGVLGACLFWGLDNNLTRKVSAKDPLAYVTIKGFGAGSFSLILSLVLKNPFPAFHIILLALLVGGICYGVGLAFFVLALRSLGAARTGALYATAPFVGAALSFILFRENLTLQFLLSLPLMALGAVLLVSEHHEHVHWHPAIQHEHLHTHNDLHHSHEHPEEMVVTTAPHSHPHLHEPISHDHPHTPDLHHWHPHKPDTDNSKGS